MAYTLLGYKNLDFKSQDGTQIKGMQLFLVKDIDPRDGEGGEFVLQQNGKGKKVPFINADILSRSGFKPKVGGKVELSTDLDGKIDFVRAV